MLSRKAEDYLETIYLIMQKKGYVRIKDIAKALNVKPPSVTEMMKKLSREDFVVYERYGGISLTKEGEEIARIVKDKHETFIKLLKIIQVPDEIAKRDAYKLEHHLHPITIEQFKKFIEFVEYFPAMNPRWLTHFIEFCETGKLPECVQIFREPK